MIAALAGCGPPSDQAIDRSTRLEPTDDAQLLAGAIDVEQRAAAAYRLALPRLSGAALALARALLAQEREHAAALTAALRGLGAPPPPAPAHPYPAPRDAPAALALLQRVEDIQIAYYVDAIPKLSQGLRRLPSTIVASDAAHLALVRAQRGRPQLPQAFVLGAP